MAAFALVLIKGLTYGRPGSRPVIPCFAVLKIDVTTGLVHSNRVEAVTDNTSVCAGFNEAVAACVIGNNCAVFGRAEIVRPCRGSIGTGNHILFVLFIKKAVIHWIFSS